jgi:hypothetical protein
MLVRDFSDGVVANGQSAELLEVGTGSIKRPTGSGQAQQALGLWANEPGDPETFVQWVLASLAARADEIESVEANHPGSG